MVQLLVDKTAVVTGASSGIGRAVAMTFAEHGADVVVADIRTNPREGGPPVVKEIESETDANAEFVECDVSKRTDLEAAVDTAEKFGGIDIMVNNAATRATNVEGFTDMTEDLYEKLLAVNLKGVFLGCQVAAQRMLENGTEGCILNASGTGGIRGAIGFDRSLYSTAKGGVRLLTYSLGGELGPEGIRVNAIHPGPTETMMTVGDPNHEHYSQEAYEETRQSIPLRRWAEPEDIANAYVLLASDLASFINAESVLVDGGQLNTS